MVRQSTGEHRIPIADRAILADGSRGEHDAGKSGSRPVVTSTPPIRSPALGVRPNSSLWCDAVIPPPSSSHSPWTYADALAAIWARSGYDRGWIANPFGGQADAERSLRRVGALLAQLGDPKRRYGIVHVAGSKGKGSTCAMIAAVLGAAGHRVGLTTSPHLHTFRERIVVDGEAITETGFAALAQRVVRAGEELEGATPELGQVTAFELVIAMAFDHFAHVRCDLAVVEVGLGGTYDATNVVSPLVSAITRLDLEHTAVLGNTIEEIAAAKAGIIKPGRPVVVSPQPPAAAATIARIAGERGSSLLMAGRDWHWTGDGPAFDATGSWGTYRAMKLGLIGEMQRENACTAIAGLWVLSQSGVSVPEPAIREGLAAVHWPGRFEEVSLSTGTRIILDGAHTPASTAALAATVRAVYPDQRVALVVGSMSDKDAASLIGPLAAITRRIVVTRSRSARAVDPASLVEAAHALGQTATVEENVAAAMARATTTAGLTGMVLVTGSLAIVAEAREWLGLAVSDPPMPPAG